MTTPDTPTQKSTEEPELFIALVGAIGTSMDRVCTSLSKSLSRFDYDCGDPIRLSELLHEIPGEPWSHLPGPGGFKDDRYHAFMSAGNRIRRVLKMGEAVAMLAIGAVRDERLSSAREIDAEKVSNESGGNVKGGQSKGDVSRPLARRAYIFRSLKHPNEVEVLRKIYGSSFFLVGAYSPRDNRLRELAQRIATSRHSNRTDEYLSGAQELLDRDEKEEDDYGQNVRDSFPLADVFVNAGDPVGLQAEIDRFVDLVFGHPFHTPTREEYSMFLAQAAALRSASLSRQVGAVISTTAGDVVAVGTNEVPKAGGGLYWYGDKPDGRDWVLGHDTSDRMRRTTLAEVLDNLVRNGWLNAEKAKKTINELVEEALDRLESPNTEELAGPVLRKTQLMDLIEFVRAEHAEMAALLDAARRGVAVEGCTLYSTTYPCHDCARHIVAAGIHRVFYVQPYPKSLALELHRDSIVVDSSGVCGKSVSFLPFVGIAPRQYLQMFSIDLFTKVERKQKDGTVSQWPKPKPVPRFQEPALYYLTREQEAFEKFERARSEKGLT